MADTATLETPQKTTADAESYEQHKAIRSGKPAPPAEPKPKAEEKEAKGKSAESSDQPAKGRESAEAPEASKQDTQEDKSGEKPKRDRSAEGRIHELTREREERDRRIADLERQLAEKTQANGRPATQETAKPEPSKAEASEDPKPKVKDFVDKLKPGETYEDAIERYEDAAAAWRYRKAQAEAKKTELESQREATHKTVRERITEARAKYSDFDAIATGVRLGYDANAMASFLADFPLAADILYHLGKHPEDQQKVIAANGSAKLVMLAEIAAQLRTPAAPKTPPEDKKPVTQFVSKAPPPGRVVSGAEPAAPKKTSDATSFEEHKRLRLAKRA